MQTDLVTPDELRKIALILVDRHGDMAFDLAGDAIAEMQDLGDQRRILAWVALRSVIADALNGHIDKAKSITLH